MGQIASQALARKWRPRDFDSLVGQEHVVQALSHALNSKRLHHAYLLTGTRGVGKTTIARILAKAVNCETGISANPCGQCQACQEIAEGRFSDLLEVDAATNTRVDEMRQLLDNAAYMPTAGRYKVYVIDEVHMLSTSSFNAMLKTLEEPPEHVVFILATTDPQKIPATVLSRCLQFSLRQLGVDQLASHLTTILESEGIDFEAGALRLLAKAARGSVRDALSLTDQAIAYGANTLTEPSVRQMLGFVDENLTVHVLKLLAANDGSALMQLAQELSQQNVSFSHLLDEFAGACFHLSVQNVANVLQGDDPDHAHLLELSEKFSAEDLQLFYQIAIHARDELHLAPEQYIGFGMALIRMLCFQPSSMINSQAQNNTNTKTNRADSPAAAKALMKTPRTVTTSAKLQQPIASAAPEQKKIQKHQGADVALAAVQEVIASRNSENRQNRNSSSASTVTKRVETPPNLPATELTSATAVVTEEKASFDADDGQAENLDANRETIETLNTQTWPKLAASLPATGLIRQALVQSEFIASYKNDDVPVLSLRIATKSLADGNIVQKLQTLLASRFGVAVQVQFDIGQVHSTASLQAQSARKQSLENAEQAITSDPFVQKLQQEMGATLVPGSIRPLRADGPADL